MGCGISNEVLKKLFREMVTTKGKKGTGLRTIYVKLKAQFDRKNGSNYKRKKRNNNENIFTIIIWVKGYLG